MADHLNGNGAALYRSLPHTGGGKSGPGRSPGLRLAAAGALILVPLILAVAGYLLFQELDRARTLRQDLNRSYATQVRIQRVLSQAHEAETGVRGYVITGDTLFLGAYDDAREHLTSELGDLQSLAARSTAEQKARVEALRGLVASKISWLENMRATRESGDAGGAAALVASGRGEALMQQIRTLAGVMTRDEARRIDARTGEDAVQTERTRLLVLVLFAFLLAFVLTAAGLVAHNLRVRQRLLGRVHDVAARQQAIFDSAIDAIITLNPSGSIETINAAGERMFGYRAEALLRRDVALLVDLAPEGDGSFLQRLGSSLGALQGGILRELSARRADGSEFPVDLALGAMELPDGLHVVAVVRDISDRKRIERLKDEFVSTVSHELRTPLTSIAGSLGLLVGGAAGDLPERASRLIGIAHANCLRLVRLINDILDIEKIESGKLRFEMSSLSLSELAARSVEGLRGYADEVGVEVQIVEAEEMTVRGDADRLVQVVTNLLSNAIKFSPPGGSVEVTVGGEARLARLSVRDRGPGIPEEFRNRIFAKFAQADSSDARQKGGTGLGLAIAKEIVDRHGGRLWFETKAGEGTVFHLDLPVAAALRHEGGGAGAERVLICEDDPDAAAVLREALLEDGLLVDVVGTRAEAAAAIAEAPDRYGALLLDLQLPDGDGVSLIKDLREQDQTRDLPIIVVSGFLDAAREAARTDVLNVVDWMEKPVDIARLRQTVEGALTRSPNQARTILHVDDDHDILQVTAAALAECGEIVSVDSLAAARAFLAQRTPDLVILDLGLADGSGLELLPDLDGREEPIPVLVFSAQDTDQRLLHQVDAVLTKSKTSLGQLARTVRRMIRSSDFG